MTLFIRFIISLYQKTISPDHGKTAVWFPYGFCRFYPSCSEYMKNAIVRYGAINGMARGIWRIVRCNPRNKGGIDKAM